MFDVTVHTSGPFFDGRADKAAQDASDDIARVVSTLGAAEVRAIENVTFKKQTPFYRVHVQAKVDPPGWKIWDQGIVYGPWLEGTGSRNRTTRFKGYMIFRRVTQRMNARAAIIGDGVVARFMGRMN